MLTVRRADTAWSSGQYQRGRVSSISVVKYSGTPCCDGVFQAAVQVERIIGGRGGSRRRWPRCWRGVISIPSAACAVRAREASSSWQARRRKNRTVTRGQSLKKALCRGYSRPGSSGTGRRTDRHDPARRRSREAAGPAHRGGPHRGAPRTRRPALPIPAARANMSRTAIYHRAAASAKGCRVFWLESVASWCVSLLRRSQRISGWRRTMPEAVHGTSARMRSYWLAIPPIRACGRARLARLACRPRRCRFSSTRARRLRVGVERGQVDVGHLEDVAALAARARRRRPARACRPAGRAAARPAGRRRPAPTPGRRRSRESAPRRSACARRTRGRADRLARRCRPRPAAAGTSSTPVLRRFTRRVSGGWRVAGREDGLPVARIGGARRRRSTIAGSSTAPRGSLQGARDQLRRARAGSGAARR